MTGTGPPEPEAADRWQLVSAGAMAGVAAAVFVASLLAHARVRYGWWVGSYEPVAALLGALGVWCFGTGRGVRAGLIGVAVALIAMLLGDLFMMMADSLAPRDWSHAPLRVLGEFQAGRNWPKLLRYAFGVYIGWHLCAAGRSQPDRLGGDECG